MGQIPAHQPRVTRAFSEFAVGELSGGAGVRAWEAALQTIAGSVVAGAAASRQAPASAAYDLARCLETPPDAAVLGRRRRVGAFWAPLVNGTAMRAGDIGDTRREMAADLGAPVVAAALTAAELGERAGAALCEAVLVGVEVAVRVQTGLGPGHAGIGWDATGTAGRLGAAAAAARLLGLDRQQATVALGLAAAEAAGLAEAHASMTAALHAGKAAADGVEAAMLARAGLVGPDDPIESPRGLAALMAEGADFRRMLDGLGARWHAWGGGLAGAVTAGQSREWRRAAGRLAPGAAAGHLHSVAMSVDQFATVAPLLSAARDASA